MSEKTKRKSEDKLLNENDFKQKNGDQTQTLKSDMEKINFAELPIAPEQEE